MAVKKIFFKTKDNLRLAAILHLPKEQTDKVIVMAHGLSVNKDEDGIFINLANLFADNGYAALRFDFRGRGESEGKSIDMTLTTEVVDLSAAVKAAKESGYNNIGLLGGSFGGGDAILYTAKHQNELKALCLWNPVLNYDNTFINPYLPWIIKRKGHMRKDLEEKGWTTIGSNGFVLGKALFDEMKITYPFEELKKITIPTIIIHGDKDTHVPYEDARNYVNNLRNGQLVTIVGGEHGFHNSEKHATLFNQAALNFFKKYL